MLLMLVILFNLILSSSSVHPTADSSIKPVTSQYIQSISNAVIKKKLNPKLLAKNDFYKFDTSSNGTPVFSIDIDNSSIYWYWLLYMKYINPFNAWAPNIKQSALLNSTELINEQETPSNMSISNYWFMDLLYTKYLNPFLWLSKTKNGSVADNKIDTSSNSSGIYRYSIPYVKNINPFSWLRSNISTTIKLKNASESSNFNNSSFYNDMIFYIKYMNPYFWMKTSNMDTQSSDALRNKNDEDIDKKIKFCLFTREANSSYTQLIVGNTQLLQSHFGKINETKILVHGFLNNVNSPMIQDLKNAYLSVGWYNVIAVDWSGLCVGWFYFGCVRNVKTVAIHIAKLIEFLVDYGIPISSFHLIGHSLGAHIAGIAANNVSVGKMPRVTGLDPAKPGFEKTSLDNRLDASDAEFVDCIHTSINLLGMKDPICTCDFYPNYGVSPQPGCAWWDFIFGGICSHGRAFELYCESILPNPHRFVGEYCKTVPEKGGQNDCAGNHTIMGEYCPVSASGVYYVVTSSTYPYAVNMTEIFKTRLRRI